MFGGESTSCAAGLDVTIEEVQKLLQPHATDAAVEARYLLDTAFLSLSGVKDSLRRQSYKLRLNQLREQVTRQQLLESKDKTTAAVAATSSSADDDYQRLTESLRTLNETEQRAKATMTELKRQGEQIKGIQKKMDDIGGSVQHASRLTTKIARHQNPFPLGMST